MPIRTPFALHATLRATLLALATWAGAPAQATVSVEVVEQGPRATVLRVHVSAPELLTVVAVVSLMAALLLPASRWRCRWG